MEEIHFNQKSGNLEKALELIEPLAIRLADGIRDGSLADDTESSCFDFESVIELFVWKAHDEDEHLAACLF